MRADILSIQEDTAGVVGCPDPEEDLLLIVIFVATETPGEDQRTFIPEEFRFSQAGRTWKSNGFPFIKGIVQRERTSVRISIYFIEPFLAQAGVILINGIVPRTVQTDRFPVSHKDQVFGCGFVYKIVLFIFCG